MRFAPRARRPHPNRRDACGAIAGLVSAGLLAGPARAADDFPGKPVMLVVPYGAGTTGDLWARMVAPRLSTLWKQPVIVDNKPGGSAMIGTAHVARSAPDGHTLLIGSLSTSMARLTNASVPFDPQVELVPVFKFLNFHMVFATNSATLAKAKDLRALVALSRSTPTGIFFGGTGPGTAFNMTAGFVLKGLAANYSEINYNGTQPVTIALVRDDVQVAINTPAAFKPQFDNGTVHPIAVLSEERYPDLPGVPTVREMGYRGFLPTVWSGVFAARGTPQRVLERIAADLLAVSMAPDMRDRIESAFAGVVPQSDPASFARELEADTRQWKEYLDSIGFKPA
ncbi:Bug family tripartite tricarboxylate transporter substrate binding protein [Pseudorhodoferax sp.]|uniref:Bug family tripartite tricarboxylate transporter substrate binding protein n=1 Tax=Pseudorhodoferax sp. TaxID=1993553 RepID=UPI0039E6F629